jgi:hypothetical protein
VVVAGLEELGAVKIIASANFVVSLDLASKRLGMPLIVGLFWLCIRSLLAMY